ncbi:hypothetical protein DWB64_11810 [Fusibacter sp. A1]|nr:hypothetical protein DWB64_11810 [Fusibacter sp. A1]
MLIGFDILNNELVIDEIEYLGLHDIERIKELELDVENDFPGGFYIYNPSSPMRGFVSYG